MAKFCLESKMFLKRINNQSAFTAFLCFLAIMACLLLKVKQPCIHP